MRVTIQKIKAVESIEGDFEHELATVNNLKVEVDLGEYRPNNWCLLEEEGRGGKPKVHSILLLNEVDDREEMVIGMSSITRQLQVGPYENAIPIKVGVDVTDHVRKLIK